MIICKYHGKTGISLCCRHIENSILDTSIAVTIIKFQIDILDDGSELLPHYICKVCAENYGLNNQKVLPSSYFGAKDKSIFPITVPVCIRCLKALIEGKT